MNIAILGEGAWGTAIALLLSGNGHNVTLWCHHDSVVHDIAGHHENTRFFPGFKLDSSIHATADLEEALSGAQIVFEGIPVKYLRETVSRIDRKYFEKPWVVLSKGIEQKTLLFPSQVVDDVAGFSVRSAVLSGPSFARDVAVRQPTAVTIASKDCDLGVVVYKIVANDYFRPTISRDVMGVQVGGALKNVLALGAGILEGAGYKDNARALFLTRGLQELAIVAEHSGGTRETLYGLSGVGDLILTAMGEQSRNMTVGRSLGRGTSLAQTLQEREVAPEGLATAVAVHEFIMREKLASPILDGIYQIINGAKTIDELFVEIMQQPFVNECDVAS